MSDVSPHTSLIAGRAEYVSQGELDAAADAFVRSMGWRNQERLTENLRHVTTSCDVMKALRSALVTNFNIYRQDQIRQENEVRRHVPDGWIVPAGDERCGFTMDACQCMKRKGHDGLHGCAHGGWRGDA